MDNPSPPPYRNGVPDLRALHQQTLRFPRVLRSVDLVPPPGTTPLYTEFPPERSLPNLDFPPLPMLDLEALRLELGREPTAKEIGEALPVTTRTLTSKEAWLLRLSEESSPELRRLLSTGWLRYEPYCPFLEDPDEGLVPLLISYRSHFKLSTLRRTEEKVATEARCCVVAHGMHEALLSGISLVLQTVARQVLEHLGHDQRALDAAHGLEETMARYIKAVLDVPESGRVMDLYDLLSTNRGVVLRGTTMFFMQLAFETLAKLKDWEPDVFNTWSSYLLSDELVNASSTKIAEYFLARKRRQTTSSNSSSLLGPTTDVSEPDLKSTTSWQSVAPTREEKDATREPTKQLLNGFQVKVDHLREFVEAAFKEATRLQNLLLELIARNNSLEVDALYVRSEEQRLRRSRINQKRHCISQYNRVVFYEFQSRVHRHYRSPDHLAQVQHPPRRQFITSFPHRRIAIRNMYIRREAERLHSMEPSAQALGPRRAQALYGYYKYIDDLHLPLLWLEKVRSDPAYAFIFRPPAENVLDVWYFRSPIHGFGMFLSGDSKKKSIVSEYCGDVISPLLANHREKQYTAGGISSVYMFSATPQAVIDATMRGNYGRFLNHSCRPIAESRHVRYHSSLQRIEILSGSAQSQGIAIILLSDQPACTEVTQDYNMTREPADEKLFCECGSINCRMYMN
ncbi:Histone-lysine N-methyltransferase MLL1 [Giardia muris]|uniref:Histone-lysine N-methyltransferase MLL1 n=1 Tax=Giardia muris TaxID=5742 RepID=A0A4Z1SR67_GIAMU|nr:Histone-lysine N-methyltransferase MLL1 [Giardia muris]|eukprot:TNJ28346.1 Histone-lysine N-methyltransferase MLL1 [Giardia muris]